MTQFLFHYTSLPVSQYITSLTFHSCALGQAPVLVKSWCWSKAGAGKKLVLVKSWCWCTIDTSKASKYSTTFTSLEIFHLKKDIWEGKL